MPAATRTGVALLTAGIAVVGVAYAGTIVAGAAPRWAPWLVALGGSVASVALFVIGAATRGVRSRGVGVLLAGLLVTLVASFGAALALDVSDGAGGPLFLGLPLRLAIVFYGVGFVPLFVLPLVHARTFVDDDDEAGQRSPADAAQSPKGNAR